MNGEPLQWEAREYEYIEKTTDWFWAVGIVTVAFAIGAILLENVLFAVLILVASGALTLHAIKKPEVLVFRIDRRGVHAGETLYPYKTLRSFWVEDAMEQPKLILESEKMLMPYIFIPLGDIDPDLVRETMLEYIPEEFHEEPVSHEVMRQLGFHH